MESEMSAGDASAARYEVRTRTFCARLERYLQLCGKILQVCIPSTPAQYFHLCATGQTGIVRPLIVMTPKSLLRLPAANSSVEDLTTGGFLPVIDDARVADAQQVKRIVLCSGKVFYDLDAARADAPDSRVAVVRVEQFYPFPAERLKEVFARYANATQIFWTQEEPQNMGGWTFVEPRLREILPAGVALKYVGRTASASPATGSYAIHNLEQEKLVNDSLIKDTDEISAASTAEVAEKLAPAGA
jgi:2-oxoglutarate dehydrogenase E1 component